VRRNPDGLGSKYLHDKVKVGKRMRAVVTAAEPIDFGAKRSVFVAEDIGVFHAWPLLRAFADRGLAWELHYDAWSRTDAALLDELREFGDRVRIHVRSERRGASLDWNAIAAGLDDESSVYATISAASRDAMTSAFGHRGLDIGKRVKTSRYWQRFAPQASTLRSSARRASAEYAGRPCSGASRATSTRCSNPRNAHRTRS
jgi:ferredoxin-NADP reductase